MTARLFVDSNVLVYAHDNTAGRKYQAARSFIEELWTTDTGVVSTQVLEEFYVVVTRKIQDPLPRRIARELVEAYAGWNLQLITAEDILQACELEAGRSLSFWDALLFVSASKGQAETLVTEDLQHGQILLGVRTQNPFR